METPPPNAAANAMPQGSTPEGPGGRLIYRSSDLLCGRREIWIEHGRDFYRLRVTSQGRLILTK